MEVEAFGGYRLVEKIGVGGMAEVFLARHTGIEGFEKEVVIKRIRPHLNAVPSFVNMFLGEAKLAAQLTHSNVAQIYDLGKIGDSYFIAMEYVPGRDLSMVMPRAKKLGIPFPPEYALKIGSNMCEALHYAHSKTDPAGHPLNIVHRDVSPENIRIAWTGLVKILDFGIAKAVTQLHETKAGEIKGKLTYMSPEQVMGRDLDHRSDIFSLGVVLYECITGLKLFSGDNDLAIMNNIIEGKIYPPSYFRDDIPGEVEAILMKALEKDRRKRYENACDMQLDIDTFLASHDFTPSSIHLSGFMKQLFKQEIEEEQRRRIEHASATAKMVVPERVEAQMTTRQRSGRVAMPPAPFPTPFEDDEATLHPGREAEVAGANSDSDEGVYDLPSEIVQRLQTEEGLLITLDPKDMALLREMAEKRAVPVESIVRDIVGHYLKYRD